MDAAHRTGVTSRARRGADSVAWSLAAGPESSPREVSGSRVRASDGAHNSPLQRTEARRARPGR